MKRAPLVAMLAALACAGLLWLGLRAVLPAEAEEAAAAPLPVQVERLQRLDHYAVTETLAGRVVHRRASDLGFDRGGRLDEVLVEEGDRVDADAVLARLDARELASQRRQLAAQVKQTEARLALAKVTAERRGKLYAADHMAHQQLDEARFSEAALAAELEAARAAVDNVDVRLALSEIRAPWAGRVDERFVDEGSVVASGEPIVRLVEEGALEVQMGVPPEAASGLETGSLHTLEIAGGRHPARLQAVLSSVEPDTRTVRVVFWLESTAPAVRAGSLARLTLETLEPGEGFWLPLAALAESRRGLWSVYVVVGDGADEWHVERRQVEVIHSANERAFVRGTLRDGERAVTTGVHRLVPGQHVRIGGDAVAASP